MINNEPTVKSEDIWSGRVFDVRVDTVTICDGSTATREILVHTGGVAIIAIDAQNDVYMVKQYRKAAESFMLEVPAGKLDVGEHHRDCGIRELKEETGLTAESFTLLGGYYVSPGYNTEVIYIYLATQLTAGDNALDEGEYLDVVKMPFPKLLNMCRNGEIRDAKTAIAIMQAALFIAGQAG